jgi:cytochrome c-type biogenesis protein CcmH/NrfG
MFLDNADILMRLGSDEAGKRNKLREHPDDAEGWALLGRTYKATEHYAEARDAFQHAVAAAPGDADFEREYAAARNAPRDRSADRRSFAGKRHVK